MRQEKLYRKLASCIDAYKRCLTREHINPEWEAKHQETIETLVEDFLPYGSGFDSGCKFDFEKSNGEKLVIETSYHHMDDNGMYSGWTEHTVTVKPSLVFGFTLTISGKNRNGIKDYMYECFDSALHTVLEWDEEKECYFSPELRKAQEAYQAQLSKEKA